MNKYITQFYVYLEDSETQISFFRALEAKDEKELKEKAKILKNTFENNYNEIWEFYNYWEVKTETPLSEMSDFLLTNKLIGWKQT